MGSRHRPGRRSPASEQLAHLAERFGLVVCPDAGAMAERVPSTPALAEALEVPYYSHLYNANVVPREAVAQRGLLDGVIALNVQIDAQDVTAAVARSQLIARVAMACYDAPGAIISIQPLEWNPQTASGTLAVEVASGRGSGDALAPVTGGDLGAVLEAVLDAVRPPDVAFAISRDPVDLRDDPRSGWRWVHPVTPEERIEEFTVLARDMAFEVLALLVRAPEGTCRPLKSVPSWYVELPGLELE